MIEGFLFGFIDNGVLLLSALIGFHFFEDKMGPLYGALIGNLISDVLAALLDPTLKNALLGISLGCAVPILVLYLYKLIRRIFK